MRKRLIGSCSPDRGLISNVTSDFAQPNQHRSEREPETRSRINIKMSGAKNSQCHGDIFKEPMFRRRIYESRRDIRVSRLSAALTRPVTPAAIPAGCITTVSFAVCFMAKLFSSRRPKIKKSQVAVQYLLPQSVGVGFPTSPTVLFMFCCYD